MGFIIGFAFALLLAKTLPPPATKAFVPSHPARAVRLTEENEPDEGSIASGELKQRAIRKILEIDVGKSGGCVETRTIAIKPVSFMQPGVLTERWSVQRCGSTVFYSVQYIPNSRGEMEMTVSRDDGFQ